MSNIKLFQKVRCGAYLKKISDGVHIRLYNGDGTEFEGKYPTKYDTRAYAYNTDGDRIADLSDFSGQSVEKIYRKRIEEDFEGFIVGYTRIEVKGIIGTDWNDNPHGGDFGFCFKEIREYPKVGVVYFKNNCKRYVLPEDMVEITGQWLEIETWEMEKAGSYCSECDMPLETEDKTAYCPHCGFRMKNGGSK